MNKHSSLWDRWLEEATEALRAHPDHDQVRQELLDHLEDRTEGLHQSFPNLSLEEAEQMALEGMGEAEELSQALAKTHSRLLGGLYELGGMLLAMAGVLVGLESMIMLWWWILPLAIPSWPF